MNQKTMKKVKELINQFIETEYKVDKMRYDESFSDEECDKALLPIKCLMHPVMVPPSIGRITNELEHPMMKMVRKKNYDMVEKRILFSIREYKNFVCGGEIKRIIKSDSIYACILSSSLKYDEGHLEEYSRMYIAADTDRGLKLIYYFRYREGKWGRQHDYKPSSVIKLGDIVAHENYIAPGEKICLRDYNMEALIPQVFTSR